MRDAYQKVTHIRPDGSKVSVWAHIAVVERVLGRRVPKGAHIHHVDGNGWNNAHSNLVVCQDLAYHKLLHARADVVKAGGNPNTEKLCRSCQRVRPFAEFNRRTVNVNLGLGSDCRDCAIARTHRWRDGIRQAIRDERAVWIESVSRLAEKWRRRAAETEGVESQEYALAAGRLESIVAERRDAPCAIPNLKRNKALAAYIDDRRAERAR